jgi:adenylate kinase
MISRKAFIFFGPPGAGKGTISRLCVDELGWMQLSTGDLFRKHIQERTLLGQAIEKAISEGKLVEDTTVIEVVSEWISKQKNITKPLIFDGFPRTIKQAQLFLEKIKKNGMKCLVIVLEIADNVVVERLLMRRTCQNYDCQTVYSVPSLEEKTCKVCDSSLYQRADDMPDTIKNRLFVYHQHANQLLHFYQEQGIEIKKINAQQSVKHVLHEVLLAAGELR